MNVRIDFNKNRGDMLKDNEELSRSLYANWHVAKLPTRNPSDGLKGLVVMVA